jgi:hypothetical protein
MRLTAYGVPLALAMALAIAGCDTTPAAQKSDAGSELDAYFGGGAGPGGFQVSSSGARPVRSTAEPVMPGSDDPALDWSDPCLTNLDEINGALLVYYGLHKSLPPSLEEMPRVSPSGERISLTCPSSGKRYVYYPEGLKPPVLVDQNNVLHAGTLLILYDAEPSHEMVQHLTDGKNNYDVKKKVRFGIVMEPRRVQSQTVQLYVVPIEQNLLDMYLRNAEQSVPVRPLR